MQLPNIFICITLDIESSAWLQSALVSPSIPTTALILTIITLHIIVTSTSQQLDPVKVFVALKYCNTSAIGSISHKNIYEKDFKHFVYKLIILTKNISVKLKMHDSTVYCVAAVQNSVITLNTYHINVAIPYQVQFYTLLLQCPSRQLPLIFTACCWC